VVRRVATLIVALAVAGCSGSSSSSPSVGTPTAKGTGAIAALSIQLSGTPTTGTKAVFPLTVQAVSSSNATISGTYASAVSVTSTDSTDLSFSFSATGSPSYATVSVTSSTQNVYVVYDGAALPAGVTISASTTTANPASIDVTEPSSSSSATPQTGTTINSLSIAANGAASVVGTAGSFTLTVAAYNSTDQLITGTYATPLTVTTNDSADLSLSTTSGGSGASVTLTSSTQLVIVTYDGKTVPAGTEFTVSAPGVTSQSAVFSPNGATGTSAAAATLKITEVGAPPIQGSTGEFALNVTAFDATGNPISGTYSASILVTTNDSADLTMATTQAGPFTAGVTLSNSSTPIFVEYDGGAVPTNAQFVATAAGATQGTLAFAAEVQPTAATPYIASLYVTGAGESPVSTPGGAVPVFITARDQFNDVITGTYPSPIGVSLNDACDESLSIGGSTTVTPCEDNSGDITNVAAIVVNSASQVVFVSYSGNAALPASNPASVANSAVSVTTSGLECNAALFPSNGLGTCQVTLPTFKHRTPLVKARI